jgi:hypothetical protein
MSKSGAEIFLRGVWYIMPTACWSVFVPAAYLVLVAVFVPGSCVVLVFLRATFGQLFVNERDANETFLILTCFCQSLYCKCLLDKYMSKSGAEICVYGIWCLRRVLVPTACVDVWGRACACGVLERVYTYGVCLCLRRFWCLCCSAPVLDNCLLMNDIQKRLFQI